ncbi:hypothetical protein ACSLVQ_30295, partial [Klebsiella pneumoniae]
DRAASEGSHEDFHEATLRQEDEPDTVVTDEPDPKDAAEPDDVIHQPGDVDPDSSEGASGEAKRVSPEGDDAPIDAE